MGVYYYLYAVGSAHDIQTLNLECSVYVYAFSQIQLSKKSKWKDSSYPNVVMVTMVYQNAAGMEVKVECSTLFSQ